MEYGDRSGPMMIVIFSISISFVTGVEVQFYAHLWGFSLLEYLRPPLARA